MKWLWRVVMFLLLLVLALVVGGGNIGPVELVVLPLVIILVMGGCSRLIRFGRQRETPAGYASGENA